jgi:hypothetical protein
VLYGSDWPFAPDAIVNHFTEELDKYPDLDEETRRGIDRGNAEGLVSRA